MTVSALRAVATTALPAASAALAMSTPMPRAAPVMNQIFLSVMSAMEPVATTSGEGDGVPGNDRAPTSPRSGRSVVVVDNRDDVRQFLAIRRARITPQQVGLPVHDSSRRVPGRRREEVAVLAGVSIDYYTRLERGNLTGVSASVLEAVARVLQLDEAERAHLFELARTANDTPSTRRRRPTPRRVRPGMQRLLDAMTDAPALVRNARLDVVAGNRLGRALFSPAFTDPPRRRRPLPLVRRTTPPRRHRPDHHRLHRRARVGITRRAHPPRQLGRHARPARRPRNISHQRRPLARRALARTGTRWRPGRDTGAIPLHNEESRDGSIEEQDGPALHQREMRGAIRD